jgi:5-methylcytosine-specific restriction endonuclease McrA
VRTVLPLSELSEESQARIAELVALPSPPPKMIRLGHVQIPSRAYYEWYAQRGRGQAFRHPDTPRWMREAVLERDGMVCQLCGGDIPDGDLHIDHILPVALGGPTRVSNLQAAHSKCNIRKGATV